MSIGVFALIMFGLGAWTGYWLGQEHGISLTEQLFRKE